MLPRRCLANGRDPTTIVGRVLAAASSTPVNCSRSVARVLLERVWYLVFPCVRNAVVLGLRSTSPASEDRDLWWWSKNAKTSAPEPDKNVVSSTYNISGDASGVYRIPCCRPCRPPACSLLPHRLVLPQQPSSVRRHGDIGKVEGQRAPGPPVSWEGVVSCGCHAASRRGSGGERAFA